MDALRWNREFALEQAADDNDLLMELIGIYKESCKKDLAMIERALKERNRELLCSSSHSIKGASASLGFESIREIAFAIEADCRAGSFSVAEEKIADLRELFSQLQAL